jgi:hypothetical protein
VAVDIEHELMKIAEEEAARHGHSLQETDAGRYFLPQLVGEAPQRMRVEGVVEPADPRMGEALDHMRRFVDVMSEEVPRQNLETFHEPTFFAAKNRLCRGLWPFC